MNFFLFFFSFSFSLKFFNVFNGWVSGLDLFFNFGKTFFLLDSLGHNLLFILFPLPENSDLDIGLFPNQILHNAKILFTSKCNLISFLIKKGHADSLLLDHHFPFNKFQQQTKLHRLVVQLDDISTLENQLHSLSYF